MTTEITRDLGGMDPAVLSDPGNQHVFDFFKLDLPYVDIDHPAVIFRFTQKPRGYIGDIDGSSQTWEAYDWRPAGLSNTNSSILEVSSASLTNLDGLWTRINLAYTLQGKAVTIWRAQFDPLDVTLIGKSILFYGRIDEVDCKDRAQMTLIPFRSAFDVLVPGRTYSRTACQYVYKDAATCQYAGGLPDCSRTLEGPNGCRAHGNILHFGAFPKMPKRGASVIWGKPATPQHYVL